ncbi:unnamed protein product [Soboliphyme baturini]|uniref:HH_signal domain-containing protein n=1 Tax=Soboliphyme baturini TaxID=241478 RepID=A0A183IC07_9BILA|nr:unnamed protein product [Soboliphyme baturini]
MSIRSPPCTTSVVVVIFVVGLVSSFLPLAVDGCLSGGRLIRRMPKREPPLVYKQHIPNVQEVSLMASGPREARIRRIDKRFKELVMNLNPDIVFRDKQGTGEDRIMSRVSSYRFNRMFVMLVNQRICTR